MARPPVAAARSRCVPISSKVPDTGIVAAGRARRDEPSRIDRIDRDVGGARLIDQAAKRLFIAADRLADLEVGFPVGRQLAAAAEPDDRLAARRDRSQLDRRPARALRNCPCRACRATRYRSRRRRRHRARRPARDECRDRAGRTMPEWIDSSASVRSDRQRETRVGAGANHRHVIVRLQRVLQEPLRGAGARPGPRSRNSRSRRGPARRCRQVRHRSRPRLAAGSPRSAPPRRR